MREGQRDDDFVDDLRRAWRELEAEAPADSLERADATTRRTVAWLRSAWSGLEAPPGRVPEQLRAAPSRLHLVGRWVAGAAAAVAAVLLATLSLQRDEPRARPEGDGAAASVTEETPPLAPAPAPPDQPRVASLSSEHVELRAGPVRLILFTQPQ